MAWAEVSAGFIEIGCSKVENHLAAQVPGCNYREKSGTWRVPASWPAWVAISVLWSGCTTFQVGPSLAAWLAAVQQDIAQAWALRGHLDDSGAPLPVRACLDELDAAQRQRDGKAMYPPQRGGAAWLAIQGQAILADDCGTGKTIQVIRALQLLAEAGRALPALVIARNAALVSWADHFADWAPGLNVKICTGTALARRKVLEGPTPDVMIIGWPSVRQHSRLAGYGSIALKRCRDHGGTEDKVTTAQCEVHDKELNAIPWTTVIADEAHALADPKSKQTRAVWHLMHSAVNRWPVTGTVAPEDIGGVWPLLHAIRPRDWPSRSKYLDLYAIKSFAWGGRGAKIEDIRPDHAQAYHASVQPMLRRIPKALALPHLPPRMGPEFRRPVLHPAQKRVYDQLAREALAELGATAELMVPPNTLVKFTRLCQLAGASIALEDGEDEAGFTARNVRLALPSNKVDDLLEFLGDNPGPLVASFTSPKLLALAEHKLAEHKITSVKITGGMSPFDQNAAKDAFQAGHARVIMLTSAGSESITLTRSDTVCFVQPNPSWRAREQIISRVDREGSQIHNGIRTVHMLSPGTVDQRLYDLGTEKGERASAITRDADLMQWIIRGDEQ